MGWQSHAILFDYKKFRLPSVHLKFTLLPLYKNLCKVSLEVTI
ncbi:hypothetical protein XBP1_580011 [Xenorhabdus bovienii str. puntauvense]|uniref:Uncharacterized protein n=1 Tax=Xenorhabdus bovienii str. puntauvense TaxID=1398201 RepID=A0A077NM62_XENBV|nr:hypothetical protein XBP1_580011 [Xenorhabdus bovienii str. puntauvense]